MKILLSIKPEYVEKILNGTKRYEYRKVMPRQGGVQSVVIYSTLPDGMVVGEFSIKRVLRRSPRELWALTSSESGISAEFFDAYFAGREVACAFEIDVATRYDHPKPLVDVCDTTHPPQSFRYLR